MAKKNQRKNRRPRFRRRTTPGAPPGAFQVDPKSPKPVIHVIAYNGTEIVEEDVTEISRLKHFLDKWPSTWINVDGLGDEPTIRQLGDLFHLHPLALEDFVNVHQRSKVEDFVDHLFIVARMVVPHVHLNTEQVSFFLGRNYLLTFQERQGDCFDPVRQRLRQGRGPIRTGGCNYLMYALLDAVIDSYFPVIDKYADRLDDMDELVGRQQDTEPLQQIHEMRGDLLLLHRAVRPHRETVNSLIRDNNPLIADTTRYFLRDCYDHTVQLTDMLDSYREVCSDLRDYYLTLVSNGMNEIMKVLTIIATIFIPLSFIAGLYGMNFNTRSKWNMPELEWPFGYAYALMVMIGTAAGMLFFFYRKGWIGKSARWRTGVRR